MTGLELRWFFTGPLPGEVIAWFEERTGFSGPPHVRTDVYFPVFGAPHLGLKLRGGKLELKWRGETKPFALSGVAEGTAEWWSKAVWPYTDGERVEAGFARLPGEMRLAVDKERRQQAVSLRDNGEVTCDEAGERGALVELTAVEAGEPGWTLGVDVLSPPDEAETVLQSIMAWWLQDYPGPAPAEAVSRGYPAWVLERSGAGERTDGA